MFNKYNLFILIVLLYSSIDNCAVTAQLAITISATGGTISNPGSYYIGQDVIGTIIITSSDVTLDLDGHVITGSIVINGSLHNVSVYNGVVGFSASDGILINNGCDLITISDITIRNASNGISVAGASILPITNISISRVIAENCALNGFFVGECSGQIVDSIALNNTAHGISVFGSTTDLIVRSCKVIQNGGSSNQGGVLITITDDARLYLLGVLVAKNPGNGISHQGSGSLFCYDCAVISHNGFGIFSQGNLFAYNCLAMFNKFSGFKIIAGPHLLNLRLSYCIAQQNGFAGSPIVDESGFWVQDNSGGLIKGIINNCVATNNAYSGFTTLPSAVNEVHYFSNYAVSNGENNYSTGGVATERGISPYYWQYWITSFIPKWFNVDGTYANAPR